MAIFKDEVAGRKCFPKDGNKAILTLETKLVNDSTTEETDALDDCILDVFGETEKLENTELSIRNDYTGIPDVATEQVNTGNTEQDNSTKGIVINISLDNVFTQGRAKMTKMKIPKVQT